MEFPIRVIGIGPGSPDYLLPAAVKAADSADYLVGGPRALELFRYLAKETKVIDRNLQEVLEYIRNRRRYGPVGVLVSGDPGFYSLLAFLRQHFPPDELEVVPGVSSVQLAFAALKLPWQNAALLSLHGRSLDQALAALANVDSAALLTDPKVNPDMLADALERQGFGNAAIYLCENLSYPDQSIRKLNVPDLRQITGFQNSVVVINK